MTQRDSNSGDGEGWEAKGLGGITGEVFIDGSCTSYPIRGLARAGSTAVEVNGEGSAVREYSINIPAAVPQTPQAAEYGAYYLFM